MAAPAVGIDLGTTYSCIGVWKQDMDFVEIIDLGKGERTMPSIVSFQGDKVIYGYDALPLLSKNPQNTVSQVKRIMGRTFEDEVVQNYIKRSNVKITKNSSTGRPQFEVQYQNQTQKYSPEQISAMILSRLKAMAEESLGCKVVEAVITVPAYFGHSQRESTKLAGEIADLKVLKLINEPTSAAVAYGLDDPENATSGDISLIFDLGGGTFDVSVMNMEEEAFEVLSTSGHLQLGGEDFTYNMIDQVTEDLKKKIGDLSQHWETINGLYIMCERAKKALSLETNFHTTINIGQQSFPFEFTREQFEKQNIDAFRQCITLVERALDEAKKTKQHVQNVVLIGGSTRIPRVKQLLEQFFGSHKIENSINPDEAVARGAAIHAAVLSHSETVPHGMPILLDITPLSLGVEVIGGRMSVVVPKNTSVPCSITRPDYTTTSDNQKTIRFQVYQGEREMTSENQKLGEFILTGIKDAEKGVPKVDVTFEIDESGLMKVSAVDQDTNSENHVEITSDAYRLSDAEIQSMIDDAKRMEISDKKERRRVEAYLSLQDTIDTKFKEIQENGSQNSAFMRLVVDTKNWLIRHENATQQEFSDRRQAILNF
eukprot:TRINITY_DN149_c0_g1_i5.p1 TRINITY_DN149_c0_g1~~TRINITY_DN149_c0_g1_i5.p1  ORF type:complete len:636 (-),score=65.93 TRINITY_DN149_c0_g1_i5:235-2031(-)